MWRGANSLVSKLEASNFPFLVLLLLIGTPAAAQSWEVANRGMNTNLRGVSVASSSGEKGAPIAAVWTSGSQGVIVRSFDEGKSWHRLYVPGGDALDFRGIVAFGASLAYVISSGEGVKSRIYKTTDGGKTWKLEFTDNRKEFFLDSIACRSAKECFALGDPINGQFLLLETTDGEHWNPLPGGHMPAALPGEGAFAASNTSLALAGDQEIFFSTGGPAARVFHSNDGRARLDGRGNAGGSRQRFFRNFFHRVRWPQPCHRGRRRLPGDRSSRARGRLFSRRRQDLATGGTATGWVSLGFGRARWPSRNRGWTNRRRHERRLRGPLETSGLPQSQRLGRPR